MENKSSGSGEESPAAFSKISGGWVKHQRSLWMALSVVYLLLSATLFFSMGAVKSLSFLWGAGLYCISIALTLKLMSSTVLGQRGVRGMMLLSTLKLIVFAGLVFTGIVSLSLDPVMLFSGAFVGLAVTSAYWFWASKKPASFY